jgi:hypothetical protein
MFLRIEKSSEFVHAQVVENKRVNTTLRQTLIDNLGARQ